MAVAGSRLTGDLVFDRSDHVGARRPRKTPQPLADLDQGSELTTDRIATNVELVLLGRRRDMRAVRLVEYVRDHSCPAVPHVSQPRFKVLHGTARGFTVEVFAVK